MDGKTLKDLWLKTCTAVIHAAPRMCITCSHYDGKMCAVFNSEVPQLYAEDDNSQCTKWHTMDLSYMEEDDGEIPF